jgi:hypothetical protein
MQRMKTFASGMVAGIAVAATTAYAAGVPQSWTRGEIEAANALFHDRSGLHFTVEPPPDPDRPQTLQVHAHPIDGLDQLVAVRSGLPGDSTIPPGPCFVAHLIPPGPPDCPIGVQCPPGPPDRSRVVVAVLHPDQFSLVAPDGTPLSLCAGTGGTVPTN